MNDTPEVTPRAPRRRDVIGTGSRHRNPIPMRASLLLEGAIGNVRRLAPPLLAVGLGLGLAGAFAGFLANADYFRAETITIVGTGRAKPDRLAAAIRALAPAGEELTLWVPDREIRRALESEPAVARVSIRRQWPSAIEVAVVEHRCAGILAHHNGSFLVSPEGRLYDVASPADLAAFSGPLVTGFDGETAGLGHMLPAEGWSAVRGAGEQVRRANPRLASRLSEIHWDPDEGLTLVLEDGLRALAGRRPLSEAGPVLEAFLDGQRGNPLPIATVDLRADDHLAWRPVVPPPPAKARKGAAVLAANDNPRRLP